MDTVKYLRISATTMCNADCWYCFNEGQPFDYSTLNDVEGFTWFIKTMVSDYGTELIRFTGGEPLENPHIFDLIRIAKDTGIKKLGLTTNGILISKYANQLDKSGIDNYAVHLYQIDEPRLINPAKIRGLMDMLGVTLKNVRFNIVLTRQNMIYVVEIIKYAIEKKHNLLILDLLQAGTTDLDFESCHCPITDIIEFLHKFDLEETFENTNSRAFRNDKVSIKLVQHYANYQKRCSYCTRELQYNPILITPNFDLSGCTHFGKQYFSVSDAIKNRDSYKLHKVVMDLKAYISKCDECVQKVVLMDNK